MRRLFPFLSILLFLLPGGSSIEDNPGFEGRKTVALEARRIDVSGIPHAPLLRPLAGWVLSSADSDFGGLSALAVSGGFTAIADTGALMRFAPDLRRADIRSLPRDCVPHLLKKERDSESLVRDPESGALWIGFEWRNAICRIDRDGRAQLYAPPAMRYWPRMSGPEAMVRRPDGRFLIFGERSPGDDERDSPLLMFDRDPSDPAARVLAMRYRPPRGYHPTDAALLPDGRLFVVNRRFSLPFSFAAIVTLVPPFEEEKGLVVSGRPVIWLVRPAIADNFEGIAISQRDGRTFVWLVSDDNFLPTQETYLLKFELVDAERNKKAAIKRP